MSERKSPFGELASVGVHMAQAWEKVLESFWQGLLGDPQRLAELARKMTEAARGVAGGSGSVRAEDVTRLADELAALEARLRSMEGELRSLTETVSSLVTYLEAMPRRKDGAG